MKTILPLTVLLAVVLVVASEERQAVPASAPARPDTMRFSMTPIGHINKHAERTFLRIEPCYQEGLSGLEQWSHVWVLFWFDRNDTPERRSVLKVHPRGNLQNPLTGVFATRSPMQPNLSALSLCRVTAISGNDIEIEGIDALDQTPVIDIKPFVQGLDTPQGTLRSPDWLN